MRVAHGHMHAWPYLPGVGCKHEYMAPSMHRCMAPRHVHTRPCTRAQSLTVHQAPVARFTDAVAHVGCENATVVLGVELSDAALLGGASVSGSVGIRLGGNDSQAAQVVGASSVTWTADPGVLTRREFVVRLLRRPVGALRAYLVPLFNVAVADGGGEVAIEAPTPLYRYVPNQALYLDAVSAKSENFMELRVPVVADGCSPFPSIIHYAVSLLGVAGVRRGCEERGEGTCSCVCLPRAAEEACLGKEACLFVGNEARTPICMPHPVHAQKHRGGGNGCTLAFMNGLRGSTWSGENGHG
eukprot:228450-Chlamydomonas_euryale.AAC.3